MARFPGQVRLPPHPVAILLALLPLGACGGGEGGEGGSWGDRSWQLEGPDLRIGSVDDPDYAFGYIQDLAVGPDGRIYTLHRQPGEVLRWTPDGLPDGEVGREGEGPGEFRNPWQLGFFGDSLWVMDSRTVRVTYFDGDGTLRGTRNLPLEMEPADPEEPWKSPPRPDRPLRDGTFYGNAPAWSREIATGELTSALHVHMDGEGAVQDTLWDQQYRTTDVLALLRDGGGTFSSQPFGDQPLHSVTDRGMTLLHRRIPQAGAPGEMHLVVVDWAGDTLLSRRLPYTPEPLPAERLDSASKEIAGRLHGFMGERMGIALGEMEEDVDAALYRPAYYPFVSRMLVTEDGAVWLERTGAQDGTWLVLGSDGEPRGQAVLPEGLRVLRIDGAEVWGVETDELDVNYLVRYRLVDAPEA